MGGTGLDGGSRRERRGESNAGATEEEDESDGEAEYGRNMELSIGGDGGRRLTYWA